MSRTARRKIGYFIFVFSGVLFAFWAFWRFHPSPLTIAVIVVLMLIPGRVLGWFWRDLLRGLRLLKERQYEESARHSQAFLDQLRARPWIRHLTWLGGGTYSRSAESLALNNLGAVEIMLDRLDDARAHLEAAIRCDEENPLPYLNLARWARRAGAGEEEILRYAAAAQERGFSFGVSDRIVMASQERFARRDGGGERSTP